MNYLLCHSWQLLNYNDYNWLWITFVTNEFYLDCFQMITIYHNPRCSKSRQTLELLKDKGIEPEVNLYLDSPPNAEKLTDLLDKLGLEASQLVRKSEAYYKENLKGLEITENELIEVMIKNPKLIERPIVVAGDRAAIGRPPEAVLEII
jgi:arsenate reductase